VAVLASSLTHTVQDGPLIVAAGISLVGVLGFLSPCVLPLVPGYLSYVAGLAGEAESRPESTSGGVALAVKAPPKRRMLIGAALFVVGFSIIFIAQGVLFGSLGSALRDNKETVSRVLGVVVIVLGLAFMGFIPALQREVRIHRRPPAGLAGAPLLGAAFGLAWGPCLTPTLGVVYSMAYTEGSTAWRGAFLMLFYCIGLGVPFLLIALGVSWMSGALGFVRRHRLAVSRIGGAFLVIMGVLLVTGAWDQFADWLRQEFGSATGVGSGL
jgi:cytochrome c-type biogenesis protein